MKLSETLHDVVRDAEARTLLSGMEVSFANAHKRFGGAEGTVAIDEVSLDIRQGEFVAVVGPSGSGKSTLLRRAAGLEQVSSGTVAVRTGSIGFIFQEATLLPLRKVSRNVELSAELRFDPAFTELVARASHSLKEAC